MGLKKISILLLVLVIILLAVPSGNVSGFVPAPIDLDLSLSRPPKIGETAELDFTVSIRWVWGGTEPQSYENARAWVEFSYVNPKGSYSEARNAVPIPLDEVLVSGELYWAGKAVENDKIELHGTVQLPREGVWEITGYFSVEVREDPLRTVGRVAVTESVSEFLGLPLGGLKYILVRIFNYLTGRSLHYLSYYPYGHGQRTVSEQFSPTVLELDIPKIPDAGEEVRITCRIESLVNVIDYSAEIKFARRLGDGSVVEIPADNLLVDGDLNWGGYLQKGRPVEFSADVIFPENGDWRIQALVEHPEHPGIFMTDTLKMHIHGKKGCYGWSEQIIKWGFSCAPKPEVSSTAISRACIVRL